MEILKKFYKNSGRYIKIDTLDSEVRALLKKKKKNQGNRAL